MNTYCGIGSRQTPTAVLEIMTRLGCLLATHGFILRSGGAPGADSAFERGCDMAKGEKEIFIPWNGFQERNANQPGVYAGVSQEALDMASTVHPAWDRCGDGARKLHARNCYQILGHKLNAPVKMVICWTVGGSRKGGTGQALRLAELLNIPIIDLGCYSEARLTALYTSLV